MLIGLAYQSASQLKDRGVHVILLLQTASQLEVEPQPFRTSAGSYVYCYMAPASQVPALEGTQEARHPEELLITFWHWVPMECARFGDGLVLVPSHSDLRVGLQRMCVQSQQKGCKGLVRSKHCPSPWPTGGAKPDDQNVRSLVTAMAGLVNPVTGDPPKASSPATVR